MKLISALIIDDCDDSRFILWHILNKHGLSIKSASNGSDALRFCQESIPHLIFLDWMMPGMSGLDFYHEFTKLPGSNLTKVLMCTALQDQSHVQQAVLEGVQGYLVKPFDQATLLKQLHANGIML